MSKEAGFNKEELYEIFRIFDYSINVMEEFKKIDVD